MQIRSCYWGVTTFYCDSFGRMDRFGTWPWVPDPSPITVLLICINYKLKGKKHILVTCILIYIPYNPWEKCSIVNIIFLFDRTYLANYIDKYMLIHKIDKVHREQREKTNLSRITPKKPKTYFYQSKNKNQGRNMLKDLSISDSWITPIELSLLWACTKSPTKR